MLDRPTNIASPRDERARLCALWHCDVLDTPPEPEFERITSLVKTILDVPVAAVSLIDSHRQWFKSIQGLDIEMTPREYAFCDYTIQNDRCMVVADAMLDPRFSGNPLVTGAPHIRSYLGAPLSLAKTHNVGALCVIDTKPRQFDDGQIAILQKFAGLVVEALELRQLANTDALTGLLTRRAFSDAMGRTITCAERDGCGASLAVFDLDHFKKVNDTYGHPAGDAVLRTVARVCGQAKRREDVLGRIGGEEFAVLMFGISGNAAMMGAESLRLAVEEAVAPEWPYVPFTASFGVADLDLASDGSALWMPSADAALYRAKKNGRNRVAN